MCLNKDHFFSSSNNKDTTFHSRCIVYNYSLFYLLQKNHNTNFGIPTSPYSFFLFYNTSIYNEPYITNEVLFNASSPSPKMNLETTKTITFFQLHISNKPSLLPVFVFWDFLPHQVQNIVWHPCHSIYTKKRGQKIN